METLETLCVALGFATLAGLNLYLVVLVTGLAINQGWVDVSSTYPELMVLGDPLVLTAAGIFFCMEFFSDKVPWVDSLWDSIHTLIRPVGGGLLAIQTLGPTDPAFEVVVGLLAGGTTLVAHSFKSGTRLALNASPEPVTNVIASAAEDVAVLGGLALMSVNPILAAIVFLTFLGVSLYLAPKFFRRGKAFFWLLFRKLASFVARADEQLLYTGLTSSEHQTLGAVLGGRKADPEWSAKVLVGGAKRFPGFIPMTFGRVVAESSRPGHLHFVGRRWWRHYHADLALDGLEITQEHRFLSEDVVLYDLSGTRKLVLRLPSGHAALANRIVESLLSRCGEGRIPGTLTPADLSPLPSGRTMLAESGERDGAGVEAARIV